MDKDTLKMLDGLVDIYMPDLKTMSSKISEELFRCRDYPDKAAAAIEEMFRQTGPASIDPDTGLMRKWPYSPPPDAPGKAF